ncbi:hypothetical protein ABT234_05200 [Streptomyces sp. NPDC001586]|uniref:hypothetical protein n=1 Tax=unclassified Streptomyces TaxID=2593676 RepID=UPI00331FD6EA
MIVPAALLPHRITVEPYLGDTAYGPAYGPPAVGIRAMVSEPQIITAPGVVCPLGSRITLPDGRTTTAVKVSDHSAPGLPVPTNVEVTCGEPSAQPTAP